MADPKPPHWLVRPITISLLWWAFAIILLATLVADYLLAERPHAGLEGTIGFGAWFGFAACLVLVAMARLLGFILKRRDDYYDR